MPDPILDLILKRKAAKERARLGSMPSSAPGFVPSNADIEMHNQFEVDQIDDEIKGMGYDPNKIEEKIGDLPSYIPSHIVSDLVSIDDPVLLQRKKAATKWQGALYNKINNLTDPNEKQKAVESFNFLIKGYTGSGTPNYESTISGVRAAKDAINASLEGDEREEALKNLKFDAGYGLSKTILQDKDAAKRWSSMGLNPLQGLALDVKELFEPNGVEIKNQVTAKLNDPKAQSEQRIKLAELENEGISLLGDEVGYLIGKKAKDVENANAYYNESQPKLQELKSEIEKDKTLTEDQKKSVLGFQKEYEDIWMGKENGIYKSPYTLDKLKENIEKGTATPIQIEDYNKRVDKLNGISDKYKQELDAYNATASSQSSAAREYNNIIGNIQQKLKPVGDYQNLGAWADYLAKQKSSQSERFPEYTLIDMERVSQDLIGARLGAGKRFAANLMSNTGGELYNGLNRFYDWLTASDDKELREDRMSDAYDRRMEDVLNFYETKDQALKERAVIPVIPNNIQSQLKDIDNDSSLTDQQKYDRKQNIIFKAYNNKDISYVANPRFGKLNLTSTSILNTASAVTSQLIGQVLLSYMSGGMGNVTKARQLATLFGTTFAQTFSRSYDQAVIEGKPKPFEQAITQSTIEALSELPFNNLEMVEKLMPSVKKFAGNLSEAQWKGLMSKRMPTSLGREVAKTLEGLAIEGGLEEGLSAVGQNAADKYLFGGDKNLMDDVDNQMLAGIIGFAPMSALGLPLRYRATNMTDKMMMYQAGYKADNVIKAINQQLADGSISQQEATERIEAVQQMKGVIDKMPMYDVNGKPLSDYQKAQYAWNEYTKIKADKSENLPTQQQEELKNLKTEADQNNSEILNGTYDATPKSGSAESNLSQPQGTTEGQSEDGQGSERQGEIPEANVGYSDSSGQEIDIKEAPTGVTEIANKVINDAFKAAKSLATAGIKIRVFQNQEDFERESEKLGQKARGQGLFMSDGKQILINLSKINNTNDWGIVWHEGAHPVMNIIRNTNPELYDKMAKGFGGLAKQGGVFAQIQGWAASDYGGKSDLSTDEAMVETVSLMGDGKIKLQDIPTSFRQQVIDFVNQVAEFLGLGQLSDTSERVFVQKAAQIALALKTGTDVSSVVGNNTSAFQNPFTQQRITAADVLATEERGDKKVIEVADSFEKAVDDVLDPQADPQKRITRFLRNAYEDLRYFLSDYKGDTGLDWYTNKVKEFDSKLEDASDIAIRNNEMPEENSLRIKENMDLFKVVLALSSIGVNPRENVKAAFGIWKTFNQGTKTFNKYQPGLVSLRTNIPDGKGGYEAPSGEVIKETDKFLDIKSKSGKVVRVKKSDLAKEFEVSYVDQNGKEKTKSLRLVKENKNAIVFRSGPTSVVLKKADILDMSETSDGIQGKGWTTKGNIVAINLDRIEKVLADNKDLKSAIEWINTKHPIEELRKYNSGVPDVEGGKGKINPKGERIGSYVIGEKLGAFHQNVAGTPTELTMDLWWSRTWNRYMGTLLGKDKNGDPIIQETPRTDNERNVMREAAKIIADSLGLEVHELQAALWYLEQQMYKRMGAAVESYSFVDGINELLLQYGKSREEIQPERYGIDSSEADQRRSDAAARAANILYGEGSRAGEGQAAARGQERKSVAFSAPLYDFSLRDQEGEFTSNAQAVRESPEYKQYEQDIRDIADLLGVNLEGMQNLIGGFENEFGKKIVEVAAKSNIEIDDFNKAIQFAAILGAIAPETQESTIAAQYVKDGSPEHNADEYVITVSDPDKAIKALTDIGVYNFSVNEDTKEVTLLNIFAYPTKNISNLLDNFASKLDEYGVQYTAKEKSALQSEYIDYNRRQEIISDLQRDAILKQGEGQRLRDVLAKASDRNQEFIRRKQGQERRSAAVTAEIDSIVADAKANGTYLKAPNGKPTKLTSDQWATVRTQNFKNWFGDWEKDPSNASKVVDENGEPRVVFHGTNVRFDEFKKEKLGSKNWMADSAYTGFFFAGDEKTSQAYVGMNNADWMGMSLGQSPILTNVIDKYKSELEAAKKAVRDVLDAEIEKVKAKREAELAPVIDKLRKDGISEDIIKRFVDNFPGGSEAFDSANKINIENGNQERLKDIENKIYKEVEQGWLKAKGLEPIILNLFLNIRDPFVFDFNNSEDQEGLTGKIKSAKLIGNDGVVFKNLADGGDIDDIFVAFEPNQIKSATENTGEFKTTDNRIQERRSSVDTDVLNTAIQERKSAAKITGKAIDSIKDQVVKLGYGYLPEDVRERLKKKQRKIDADINDMNVLNKRFENAVRESYGVKYKNLDQDTKAQLDFALRNFEGITSLKEKDRLRAKIPDNVLESLDDMRYSVDSMSKYLVDLGIMDDSLEPVIDGDKGLGVYLTRTYRKYDDPEWVKNVPEIVRARAKSYLAINNTIKELDKNGNVVERVLTEDELEGLVNYIASNTDPVMEGLNSANAGKVKVDILKGRKVIPEEIRDLMGEYKDPAVNFAKSIAKMSTLINTHQALTEIAAANIGTLFFKEPQGDFFVPVAGKNATALQPLSGLYSTKEVADAFKEVQSNFDGDDWNMFALRALAWINGAAKVGKTALSPASWVRNVIGGHIIMIKDGHIGGKGYADGWKSAFGYFFNKEKDSPEFQAKMREYIDQGILGEGVSAGEFQAIVKAAYGSNGPLEYIKKDTKLGRFTEGVKGFYSAQDDIFRVWAYENEKARLVKRKPNMTETELQEEASRKARATYPTYSELPEVVRKLAKFIPISSFPAFSAELIRTTKNSISIAIEEMKDPDMRDVGVKRMAGVIAAISFGSILSGVSSMLVDIDDDEEKALRRYLPEWSKNSQLVWLGRDENGLPKYIDLGFSDPFSYFKKPFVAFNSDKDNVADRAKDAVKEVSSPFVSPEIFLSSLIKGNKKVNESDDLDEVMGKYAGPIYEAMEPGLIASARRIIKGVTGEVDSYGQQYDAKLESLAFFTGQRIKKFDPTVGFGFKAKAFNKSRIETMDDYYMEKSKTVKDKDAIGKQLNKAEEKFEDNYYEFKKDYDAALYLMTKNMDPIKARKILDATMKDRNVPEMFRKAVKKGKPYPGIIDNK